MPKVTILASLLLSASLATAQSGNDLFQQAQKKMYQGPDFAGAIQIYDRILSEFAADPSLVAKATIDRANAKELSARLEAQTKFEQILRDYADQPTVVEYARRRLDEVAFQPGIHVAEFDQRAGVIHGPVTRLT